MTTNRNGEVFEEKSIRRATGYEAMMRLKMSMKMMTVMMLIL